MKTSHATCQLVELKFAPDDVKTKTFSGYGAVFGNVDAYGDVIEPGAFANFLADAKSGRQPWPAMLSQHGGYGMSADDMTPVGVWDELVEDGTGLRVAGTLADTPRGTEIYTLMKMAPRPAINGLSIGYITKEAEPRSKPDDPRRRLKRLDLVEISPVTFPANLLARVGSVKAIEDCDSLREIEDLLSDLGLSKRQSMALIAQIKRVGLGDPADANGGLGDPVADVGAAKKLDHLIKILKG